MKPLSAQMTGDEVAQGLHNELSEALCELMCVDRPLHCPPSSPMHDPKEQMYRVLLRYSLQSRAYAVRKLLKTRLCTYH